MSTQQGARCFGSNGITTTTENTSRFANSTTGIFHLDEQKQLSIDLLSCSVHHVSQGNGPVPLQVGIRITSKSTYVVLLNGSTPESESYARVSSLTPRRALTVLARTGQLLRLHIPSRFASLIARIFIPDSMAILETRLRD